MQSTNGYWNPIELSNGAVLKIPRYTISFIHVMIQIVRSYSNVKRSLQMTKLKSSVCALVRTTWTNLETSRWSGVGGVGVSCPLFFFLVTLLHDHDKKQHEGVICTCIHCHCVLGSPEPPAINLHLDPEAQGRWCWMKIKIPHKIL